MTNDIIKSEKKEGAQNDTKKLQNRDDKHKNRQKGSASHTSRKQKTRKVSHLDKKRYHQPMEDKQNRGELTK